MILANIASFFKKIFSRNDKYKLAGYRAYVAIVEQARKPFLYESCGVADNIDGRFDAIVFHVFLLTHSLKDSDPEFIRAVWEAFFSDMDRSLREMGVSDTGVGKRIKKMAQAFYGRMDAYSHSFEDKDKFKESIKRNLYRGGEIGTETLDIIINYANSCLNVLNKIDKEQKIEGNIYFQTSAS